jgi:protein-tyrosine kinase
MSRNFELLHEVGKAQEMLRQQMLEERAIEPMTSVLPSVLPAPDTFIPGTPSLEIGGTAKQEVTKLVHQLFLAPGTSRPRQIVFVGTEAGNGCSWICAHAADILASQCSRSVCVVDCDVRFPTLHEEFRVRNHYGLAEALQGDEPIRQFVQQLSHRNLWLLSCGALSDNSQQMLTLDRMRKRLAELRNEFDYVLLDVAPMNMTNHGVLLGTWCDGVALVLKANSSNRKAAQKVLDELKTANAPVVGAVLNQRTFPIPEAIYNRL